MDSSSKKVISVLMLIYVILDVFLCIRAMLVADGYGTGRMADCFMLVTVIFAVFYAFIGYKKAAAKYYHWFMVSYTIAIGVNLSFYIRNDILNKDLVVWGLPIFGMMCILSVAKDLGKKNSMILGIVVLIGSVAAIVVSLMYAPGIYRGGNTTNLQAIYRIGVQISLAVIMNLMIIAKYKDKAARGSK